MVRKAYTRLFLADLIARRVQDEAPPQYIVAAWKEYVQSVKEWNADLMINISGMANFYDDQKGLYLETVIQPDLIATDSAVRKVALAPSMRASLQDPPKDTAGLEKGSVEGIGEATSIARYHLYSFILCLEPKSKERKQKCADERKASRRGG